MKETSYHKGQKAEDMAVLFLKSQGYQIIERNHKNAFGEIDIIAQKQTTIIGVEVKVRKDEESALYAISEKQKHRILNSLSFFLSQNSKYEGFCVRIDAVLIYDDMQIKHLKNAWQER